jgi:hypothetical protein
MEASKRSHKQPAQQSVRKRGDCPPGARRPPRAPRSIELRPVRREPADLDRFVAALLAMALAELDEERCTTHEKE